MLIYVTLISLILLGQILNTFFNKRVSKIYYCIIIAFLIFIVGFRSLNVGPDTGQYDYLFSDINNYSFKKLISQKPHNLEYGFLIYCWLLGRISTSSSILFFLSSAICFSILGIWIYKNCKNPYSGLLIFCTVFLTFFLTGLRQCLAISLVILSYMLFEKKKRIGSLVIFALAVLFHTSAIFALLLLFIKRIRKPFVYCFLIIIVFLILTVLREPLFKAIVSLLAGTRYENYTILGYDDPTMYTLMLFLIGIGSIVIIRAFDLDNKCVGKPYNYYCFLITAIPIMPFVAINGNIMRVALYFSVFMVLWIPTISSLINDKKIRFAFNCLYTIIVVVLFFVSISNSPTYQYEFGGWNSVLTEV